MATINEIISSIELELRTAKTRRSSALEAQCELLEGLREAGRKTFTDAEHEHMGSLKRDAAKATDSIAKIQAKLDNAKQIKAEDDAADAASRGPAPADYVPPVRPSFGSTPTVEQPNPGLLMVEVDHSDEWRNDRGERAVLAKDERFSDHPASVAPRKANTGRDRFTSLTPVTSRPAPNAGVGHQDALSYVRDNPDARRLPPAVSAEKELKENYCSQQATW